MPEMYPLYKEIDGKGESGEIVKEGFKVQVGKIFGDPKGRRERKDKKARFEKEEKPGKGGLMAMGGGDDEMETVTMDAVMHSITHTMVASSFSVRC